MEKLRILNRNQLKYIVIAAMLIDHIAWAFVPYESVQGIIMHFIGRLTGPTMAFFVAEGYLHTSSVKKYALRLGIFALISWVPFSLFESGKWPTLQFGVIYTLFLALITVWVYDNEEVPVPFKILVAVAACCLSMFGDWPVFDILWPLMIISHKDDESTKWWTFLIVTLTRIVMAFIDGKYIGISYLGLLVAFFIVRFMYNGQPGSRKPFHKWFFYIFYPIHLLVLAALKYVMM